MAEGAVLYFHGSSAERDTGPSNTEAERAGVDLIRHVRPGYDDTDIRPESDLQTVARRAVDDALSDKCPIVVMGFSGGGPYALAAGSLRHPAVRGVCLLGSWGPMDPPHRGLPAGVRFFMRLGRWAPRPVLRYSLAAVGLRNPGQVDDVRRVARPWGFTIDEVANAVPVAAWHAAHDPEVPIAPWAQRPTIQLHQRPGSDHHPTAETWREALGWARTVLETPTHRPRPRG